MNAATTSRTATAESRQVSLATAVNAAVEAGTGEKVCRVPLPLSQCVVGERQDEVWIKEEGRGEVGLEDRTGGEKKLMGIDTCISETLTRVSPTDSTELLMT